MSYGDDGLAAGSIETPKDIGLDDADLVRRWLLELKLSSKGEDQWRKKAKQVYDRYRGGDRRKNNFNILWSNTETLRPAIYNSTPKPDVRRRYRDADPLGKAVSDCLTRALDFSCQAYDLDICLKADVLDALLPGRGVSRIRYIPNLRQVSPTGKDEDEPDAEAHEPMEGEQTEELEWEQVTFEHVAWTHFRRGPGRTWAEVQWVAFLHDMNRKQCIEKFGDKVGKEIKLNSASDEEIGKMEEKDPVKQLFATGQVWEVWDKDSKKVYFITDGYRKAPCAVIDDPLELEAFFPLPRPMQFIEDTDKLEPIPPFQLYEGLAGELDNAVFRRAKIIDALKVRGVYDATIGEIGQVMRGNDNDLIPAKNVSAFLDRGGLDKMVWMMPIDMAAQVLQHLDDTIDRMIQAIYEICGIGDILRASTDPNETATAQTLKSQWGTMRMQRMQREVQRYARDMIRMMAEVIGKKFQPETLQKMTLLPFLTEAQWQAQLAIMQSQQQSAAQQAVQSGQQPPPPQPPPQKPILWDDIVAAMRDSGMRAYHVDIETDSTVADQLQNDMQGMVEVVKAVSDFIQGISEAVISGALPMEAVKEIIGAFVRRARLGGAVEDAFDKMQQPQPPNPNQGEQAKVQAQLQIEQAKIASQEKMHAAELQQKAQLARQEAQDRAQADMAKTAAQQHSESQQNVLELQQQAEIERQKQAAEYQRSLDVERLKAESAQRIEEMRAQTELAKAHTAHETELAKASASRDVEVAKAQIPSHPEPQPLPDIAGMLHQALQPVHQHLQHLANLHAQRQDHKPEGPKEIIIRHIETHEQ